MGKRKPTALPVSVDTLENKGGIDGEATQAPAADQQAGTPPGIPGDPDPAAAAEVAGDTGGGAGDHASGVAASADPDGSVASVQAAVDFMQAVADDAADAPPLSAVDHARRAAASSAGETAAALADGGGQYVEGPGRPALCEAASFALANRDAPASSIPVHLALNKLGGTMQPTPRETTVWTVFKTVFLLVHDQLEAEAKAAAAAQEKPPQQFGMGGAEHAFEPPPAPFAPAGFTPD